MSSPYQLRIRLGVGDTTSTPTTDTGFESEQSNLPSTSKKKSKSQNWRNKLQHSNPQKYEEVLSDAKEYSKLYRLKMSLSEVQLKKRNLSSNEKEEAEKWLERKVKSNEKAKERMRRMKQRKQDALLNDNTNNTATAVALTRQKHEDKKEKERLKKQKQRQKYTKEQKEKNNERRRQLYKQQKSKDKIHLETNQVILTNIPKTPDTNTNNTYTDTVIVDNRSADARRKACQRAKQALPCKRLHFVNTLVDVLNKASPEKKTQFSKAGVKVGNNIDEKITEVVADALKNSSKNSSFRKSLASSMSKLKKFKLQRSAAKRFGVSRKLIQKAFKNTAGRKAISIETITKIKSFYEENSSILPDKKLVSKKTLKPRHILNTNITDLHAKYNEKNQNNTVCKSIFFKHRPVHVKTKQQAKYEGCLCEYCENIVLKIECIKRVRPGLYSDVYGIVNSTLCKKDTTYHHPDCISRRCSECGIATLNDIIENDQVMEWKRWEYVTTKVYGKGATKEIKKRSLVSKSGTVSEFLQELKQEMQPMAEHLFNKDWQNCQQKNLSKSLKANEVLGVFDFAENFKCSYQREVQSAYYAHDSATVHPIVLDYNCPHCHKRTTESCVMISNDLNHDYNLVNKFQEVVSNHLKTTRGVVIDTFYRYSDGCSSQYKSKGPISDISYAKDDFNHNIIHNYSGTRHGKGASDGESGVVKRRAADAIMSGEAIINTPKALFDFLDKKMRKEPADSCCSTFQRSFFYIAFEDVKRDRPNRVLKTVPGTRKLHSIRNVAEHGVVAVRKLSCFCEPCRNNNLQECENIQYVEAWKEVHLEDKPKVNDVSTVDLIETEEEVTNDAVAADVTTNDVTTNVVSTDDVTTDDLTVADLPGNGESKSKFNLENLHAGQFVIVSLPFRKSNKEYIAQITELVSINGVTEYQLSYMEALDDGSYRWPSDTEMSIESYCSIKTVISPPQLNVKKSNSRIQYFSVEF